ncbi:hypothetical protein [Vibrio cyclitrophicus]|uniref:hypothetical protein n=1 Tax=Vibrio cyclitrophicus TaxID=47951 RepID=UPI0002F45670|nr:hypothetical protein [Vibrio cyclitrophicus]OCH49522.1 hypothetical protein A6D96_12875 [Vibrio cyclitrophicus]
MESSWIAVADTAIKIGLGALIAAVSGYVGLIKSQKHENDKVKRENFYRLQKEKKDKYLELLVQSQDLIQSHLYISSPPDSIACRNYIRAFNEAQLLSEDSIRMPAFEMYSAVEAFVYLRKEQQDTVLVDGMVSRAREKVSIFQKVAQVEVTQEYSET